MTSSNQLDSAVRRTLAVIMGGGAGTRLFPLTKDRSKPAVPLAGKYRLVDIPISNCIHSGLGQIYVLTQFNSTSLHRHINNSYKFDHFSRRFVEILAAQQAPDSTNWYQGTADAVRQNLRYFLEHPCAHYLILSGDQLYRMDFRRLLEQHLDTDSDITIATIPVTRETASGFGIMQADPERHISRFVEKPKDPAALEGLQIPGPLLAELGQPADAELYQASMGIYVFNRKVLVDCLDNDCADFGKHIIPQAIGRYRISAHIFQGYWEDIGTIGSFFEANLALTNLVPPFSFFEGGAQVFTHPRFLPASKINGATIKQAIISDGCIISDAHLERCVVGVRTIIHGGATLRNSVIMGADFFEHDAPGRPDGSPPIGIGRNSVIEHSIVDKNARIGKGVVITPAGKPPHFDGPNYFLRDGVVVIPKNAVVPDGAWI